LDVGITLVQKTAETHGFHVYHYLRGISGLTRLQDEPPIDSK